MVKGFARFVKVFWRSRRGMLGVFILVVFVGVAVLAQLFTPYHPTADTYLSGIYSTPLWFKYLPGYQNLTENVKLVNNPGFDGPAELGEWNYTVATSPQVAQAEQPVSIDFDRQEGRLKPGSVAVKFTPKIGQSLQAVSVNLTRTFQFPYAGVPNRFKGDLSFLTQAIENASVRISAFIEDPEGKAYVIWEDTFYQSPPMWSAVDQIDSIWQSGPMWRYFNNSNPAPYIFKGQGYYTYGIEILFSPKVGAKPAAVYLDDIDMKIFGTSFGILGTDFQGKDIFTDLVYGARISLFVGLLSAVLSVGIGLIVGLLAGYLGKITDEILMRFSDMLLVLPGLPLLLVLVAVLGPSLWNIIFLIGLMGWMGFARVVRSQVLSLRERPFVEAAKSVGAGKFHIIRVHVLPNVMSLVYVTLALSVPSAIITEAALSWLGLFDPTVMSWGRMLHDAQAEPGGINIWWWVIPPGLAIAVVSLSFILLGYALDEILNPRLRQRR